MLFPLSSNESGTFQLSSDYSHKLNGGVLGTFRPRVEKILNVTDYNTFRGISIFMGNQNIVTSRTINQRLTLFFRLSWAISLAPIIYG